MRDHFSPPALDLLLAILLSERADLLAAVATSTGRTEEVEYLKKESRLERDLRSLTGESATMRAVRKAIGQVAPTDSTVLILGETGTGKELIARAIHQLSPRRHHLLVTVNCAALPAGLLASELFGHEKGAFTGATQKRVGRFELADRGTLFLDEIAEMPAETQVLLLRVLQQRTFERVGGNQTLRADVRILAATHRKLEEAVADGRFRADLFYRLNVFPIQAPPLRERREDIPDLVKHFLHQFNRRLRRQVTGIGPASLDLLLEYSWPGNVRELENVIERAMIVADGPELTVDPRWLVAPKPTLGDDSSLAETERRAIEDALRRAGGRIYGQNGAAKTLGLKPTTLYAKMKKLGISRGKSAADSHG